MNSQTRILLHLSLIPGISPIACKILLDAYARQQGEMHEIYAFSVHDFMQLGLTEKAAQAVVAGLQDHVLIDRECLLLEKYSWVRVITLLDDEYPELLREIHVPPLVLYVKGVIPKIPYIALVGARAANEYGKQATRSFIQPLVEYGFGIVSGGAKGIDICAHQQAVACGGATVVVLGTSVTKPYPAEHNSIFDDIVQSGGALISPYSLQTMYHESHFPKRNRIIAGMAQMTVVIQAAVKRGALITSSYALQEGRSVGAVPGHIDDPLSAGCHKLIHEGGCLVQSAEDILTECGFLIESVIKSKPQAGPIMVAAGEVQGKVVCALDISQCEKDPIVSVCQKPITLADICAQLSLDEVYVQQRLFELQLEGQIEQDFAGLWLCIK